MSTQLNAAFRLLAAAWWDRMTRQRLRLTATTLTEYLKDLKSQGIEPVAKGSHAFVFQHPTDPTTMVKVFTHDPAFESYTKFCQSNPDNPYLLKIKGEHHDEHGLDPDPEYKGHIWNSGKTGLHVIFMEKLTPISDAQFKKFIYGLETICFIPHQKNLSVYQSKISPLWTRLCEIKTSRGVPLDPNLKQFAEWLVGEYTTGGGYPDIHKDNFMMRGRQVVVVDPTS